MPISPTFSNTMKKAISLSHERSKVYKIDPNITQAPENAKLLHGELQELIRSQENFYTIAKEEMHALYELIQNTGFCLTLADKSGYILYHIGDKELEQEFQNRHCIPGYRWSEMDMGTCGISLVLIEKKPIFIQGNEMYVHFSPEISSACSPIFDENNTLLGALSLSGYTKNMHEHSLNLVCQTAKYISCRLKKSHELKELQTKNNYLNALLETSSKAIIALDLNGVIKKANQKALAIFNLDSHCIGLKLKQIAHFDLDLSPIFNQEKNSINQEININNILYFIDIMPIYENNLVIGAILRIVNKQELILQHMEITNLKAHVTFSSIIGKSPIIQEALEIANVAANSNAPLLLNGETGVGKKLFAQAIHNMSKRKDKPFVALSCTDIPSELLEKELFGYEENSEHKLHNGIHFGKLEQANQGTLYIDEIVNLPYGLQYKILKAIQSGNIYRVGNSKPIPFDVRLICSTSKDLKQEVNNNNFRQDLLYKISMLSITIPPVRERKEDIPLLIDYFLKKFGDLSFDKHINTKMKNLLCDFPWHENVYQIEKVIERAVHIANGKQLKAEFFDLSDKSETCPTLSHSSKNTFLNLEMLEKHTIEQSILEFQGNMSHCAKALGISRPTLYRKIERYKIKIDGISLTS